jgi:biotin carboxyl carrier protein
MYRVYAEVDGTWNATGQRVDGTLYEIVAVEGETLQLSDGQRTFSAGTSDQEMYLRRVVARRGERIGPVVSETPVSIPTPVMVTIRVPHVFDPETEILVKPGDVVEKGQKLAELRIWRSRQIQDQVAEVIATPAPVPKPTPTASATPEVTGETVVLPGLERAWAELELARSLATRAAAPPSVEEIDRVCLKAETMRRQLWRDQIARDMAKAQAIAWEAIHVMEIDLDILEGDIATADAECAAIRERQYAANPDDLAVAAAQLRLAEVEYRTALVALTPTATRTPTPSRTPTPTRTPTATKTPRPTPEAEILALVAGTVAEVRVASVIGNEATVEIVIQVAETP